jgi:CheY-like chemotaxis protein
MTINALWVEEEPSSLRYERGRVKYLGWNITSCDTVVEASKLIRAQAFDVVILDLILPTDESALRKGMVSTEAGIALLNDIRNQMRPGPTPPDVPLLVVSAIGSKEQRFAVVKMLSSERYFIQKPVDEKAFLRAVHELDQKITKQPEKSF